MDFRILGPLEVEQEGRPVRLGGPRQQALLVLLLLNANDVVPSARLIEEIWGDEPPETARTALQVHVSQLRKALGAEYIETRAPGYKLDLEPGRLDLSRFEQLVTEGRGALAGGDAERASNTLREALSIWRGSPFPALEDVGFARRERLRLGELRIAALEERIEADLQLGRHAEVVPELEALLAEHPLRERLRAQLMLALYRCGRQAEALDVYRHGRALADELGLLPGESLRRLERAILQQDPALAAPEAAQARAPAPVPTGTVTFLFTDIEGSTRLLNELGDAYGSLLEQQYRLLRAAFDEHGGQEIESQGDAFMFAFRRARDAVHAAVEAERAFAAAEWPRAVAVRIRIGIHTGEPGLAERGYHGLDVVRAVRMSGAAYGGQILVSSPTRDLVGDAVPGVSFRDLGEHTLRGIDAVERIFQVVAPGLADDFPPPRTADAARVMTIGGREDELAAAAQAALGAEERRVRLFRRSRIVALLGALLLAAALVGIVVALTSGSSDPAVAAAADSVAVIDPQSNRVVADVAVGARPIAIAVGEGGVWVANADDGTVSRIDPDTREVVKTIGIGSPASDIAAGGGSVWVANGSEGTVSRIDPRTNSVVETLDLSGPDELAPAGAYSVAVGDGAVWVGSGQRKLFRIDPATSEVVASVRVGQTPADVAVGEGAVWVARLGGRTLRIEPGTNAVTGTVAAVSSPLSIAAGAGSVWVGEPAGGMGTVWRIDPATVSVAGTTSVRAAPLGIVVGGGAVWVAGGSGGTLVKIEPDSGRVVRTIVVGNAPLDVAVGEGVVWLAVGSGVDAT
jgi:YVTN family beta-propeller protein